MTKKHFEWAAHYVVNEYIGYTGIKCNIKDYTDLNAYHAFRALFEEYSDNFDIEKFNKRIETLLNT